LREKWNNKSHFAWYCLVLIYFSKWKSWIFVDPLMYS